MIRDIIRGATIAVSIIAASSVTAQTATPHKLIITWYQAGIVAVDYPTKARCEAARLAVMEAIAKRSRTSDGSDIAFCIPG